ncbi:MAG TPA: hypothetical protein DCZ40_08850 [Lachnospiraceae bacterium]|nr:hypothetical protein [Lachnospiraceae bacterium]
MKKNKNRNMITCILLASIVGCTLLPVYATVAEYQYPDTSLTESSADCDVIYKTTYDFSENIPKYPELEVSASGYDGVYDGNSHGIEVDCKIVDAKITYSLDGKKYEERKPVYTNVGTYVTYYKAEKDGYTAVFGTETVRIKEAVIDYSSSDYSGIYDGKPHGIYLSVHTDGCKILYSKDGVNYSSRKPEYKEAGTYVTYFKITKDNYKAVTGSNKVIIGKQTIQYSSSDYNGVYDGKPHGITVSVSTGGCEVLYSEDGVNYSSRKPEYKEAGTYVTYFKISRDGYGTVTGRGRVVIEPENNANIGSPDSGAGSGIFNVQTGDDSSILFFAVLFAVSGIGLLKQNKSKGGRKNYEYK